MEKTQKKLKKVIPLLLILTMILTSIPITASASQESYSISDSSSKVMVDGKTIIARVFSLMLDGKDYVKVRDIANSVKETNKKFSVIYNSSKKTLTIKPGESYIAIGGENKKFPSKTKFGLVYNSEIKVYKNSKKQSVKVFTFNKEQYISIESLAKIADFSITNSDAKYGYLYKIDTNSAIDYTPTPLVIQDTTGLLKNPFPNAKLISNPKTEEDCSNILAYLVINNLMEYSFDTAISYSDAIKDGGLDDLFEMASNPDNTPELFYGAICHTDITFKGNGVGTKITIKFRGWGTQTGASLGKLNKEYFTKTQEVVQKLIDNGKITSSMTETEKAYQVFKWVALNVFPVIDEFSEKPRYIKENSATGYAAIVDRSTTSIGYTALYNLMCRYVGLTKIKAMSGSTYNHPHMWTFQELDGKKVITDVSNGFADGTEFMPHYFEMHTKEPENYLIWDKEKYSDCVSNFEYVENIGDEIDDEWYNANYNDDSDETADDTEDTEDLDFE